MIPIMVLKIAIYEKAYIQNLETCVPNLLLLPSERHGLVGLKQEVVLRSAVDDMTSGCT